MFDSNNQTTALGSVTGTGLLVNRGAGNTLRIGYDNTDFTFSGRFASNSQLGATLNIEKIGTGVMTVDSAAGTGSYNLGNLTVSQGTFRLSGAAGSAAFGAYVIPSGGVLLLDNTTSNLNNRLGGPNRSITLQGGELRINGNASAPTVESLFSPNIAAGSTLNRANGMSTLTLVPNAAQSLSLNVGAIQMLGGADGLLVRGTNLGATPGPGPSRRRTRPGRPGRSPLGFSSSRRKRAPASSRVWAHQEAGADSSVGTIAQPARSTPNIPVMRPGPRCRRRPTRSPTRAPAACRAAATPSAAARSSP
jgi:hypothetical protein